MSHQNFGPTPPQPYAPGQWVAPPAPRKSHAGRTVLIIVLAMFGLCGGGAALVFGLGMSGAAVVKQESSDRAEDITITGCTITVIESVEVSYTIVNSAKTSRTYIPRFNVTTADGTIVSDATDITQSIAAGATFKGKAVGMLSDPSDRKVTCSLVDA